MPSPMMTQFYEIKKSYPNDILFFRLGDFYEMFDKDAEIAAPILDLVLTARKNTIDGKIPMCGVPYHSSTQYIQKLIRAGYSVALCEQQGSPQESKGLVSRKVVKVITPGTILMEGISSESCYIASIYRNKQSTYIAFADLGTGVFEVGVYREQDIKSALTSRPVKEVIMASDDILYEQIKSLNLKVVTESKWNFTLSRAQEVLYTHFNVKSMQGFGFEVSDMRLIPAGALLSYLIYTQQEDLKHITKLSIVSNDEYMKLDIHTVQNLELFAKSSFSHKSKSFFEAINYTCNPLGQRLLRKWVSFPLMNVEDIVRRQKDILLYIENSEQRDKVRAFLSQIADIERIIARLSSNVGGPRDMSILVQSMDMIEALLLIDAAYYTNKAKQSLEDIKELKHILQRALVENPPILAREGGFIARGYKEEIDALLDLSQGGKDWLLEVQAKEQARTGINSLKIKYNKVFGYYIEISNAYKSYQLPEDYIKKQTLTNAERYITPEMKEFEEKILASESELLYQEQILFEELRQKILEYVESFTILAHTIAYIDCIQGGAELATRWKYTCPDIDDGNALTIEEGRHPVLEQHIQDYVSNSTILTQPDHSLMLITGPNMGGKSTYIRQVALIVLLAQMGYYVPATKAHIGVVDQIFTRVGASDNMGEGHSTFMVEMLEVANILHNATDSSLVILDEVGRGTSTYDGMSIARALVEYIHNTIQARTLFATHYHELLSLESEFQGVVNYQVKIQESENDIIFLHHIEKGGANKSYGIAIAELAGFPSNVLELAYIALQQYEQKKSQLSFLSPVVSPSSISISPEEAAYKELVQKIKEYDIEHITPIEALQILAELQKNV